MNAQAVYRVVTVALLLAMGVHRYVTIRRPAGVDDYHRRIREATLGVPHRIGPWVGQDVPVPARAIKVLDPNVMISRQYVNVETGTQAGLSFTHCSDAHDMVGHFPARCYPAQGWNVRSVRPRDWHAGELRLTGTEYEFSTNSLEGSKGDRSLVVMNCLFRPDGQVLRDMSSLSRSIIGAGGQTTGAGQLQIYFEASVPEQQREEAFLALVKGFEPAIRAILGPVQK